MASVKGVNITKIDDNTGKLSKTEVGKLKVFVDTYEAASLVAGSDITVARLPQDSTILDAAVYHDALGASSTLILGDVTDPNRYITAGSTASAGVLRMNAVDGVGFENTTETDILLTTAGATITGTIKVVIKYTN